MVAHRWLLRWCHPREVGDRQTLPSGAHNILTIDLLAELGGKTNNCNHDFHQAMYDMIKPAWSPIADYWDDVILEKLEIVKLFPQELTIFLPSTSWQNLAARRTTVTMTFTRLCTIWSNLHGRPSLTIEMMSSSRSWRSSNSSLRSSQYSYHRPLGRTWRQDEQL